MLTSLLHPRAETRRDLFVIAPHHPDRLQRPVPRPGAIERVRFLQALTWNVFRTLELLEPAFWLRRLHTRLTGNPSPAAPQVVRVSLWRPLPLPPIQRIDGARPDVVVDVAIETEHAVWTLSVASGDDRDDRHGDGFAQAADAGSWLAGAREHYCGVIEGDTTAASTGALWAERYARSRDSVELRSATRGPARPASTSVGALRWSDLAAILEESQDAPTLSAIERALARNATAWLKRHPV